MGSARRDDERAHDNRALHEGTRLLPEALHRYCTGKGYNGTNLDSSCIIQGPTLSISVDRSTATDLFQQSWILQNSNCWGRRLSQWGLMWASWTGLLCFGDPEVIHCCQIFYRWYKTDTNHVPAQSVLQPIDSILKNFLNKKDPTLQESAAQNQSIIESSDFVQMQKRKSSFAGPRCSRLVVSARTNSGESKMRKENKICSLPTPLKQTFWSCLV